MLRTSITENCTADHHSDPAYLGPWLENKTVENIHRWLRSSTADTFVAVEGGDVVGVATLGHNGTIYLCYLLPRALYQGTGRALLQRMCAAAMARGLDTLTVESTRTAKLFYQRNGFRLNAEVQNETGMPVFRMSKKLD